MRKKMWALCLFLIVSFAVCFFLSFNGYKKRPSDLYYNNARLLLADDIDAISMGAYTEVSHTLYVTGLDGAVIYTTDKSVKLSEKLNFQEILQTDNAFYAENKGMLKLVFPVEKEGSLVALAVFTVLENDVRSETQLDSTLRVFMPLIIWGAASIIIVTLFCIYINRRMLSPINEMSDSAEEIIKGNYEKSVVQKSTYDIIGSEIGRLTHSFELMRDELKCKQEREKQLQTAHKELLCCMSHDLRTPISTIKAHAEAVRDGLAPTEEKRNKYIATIITKTDVVSHMIKDLLDHSNAECNQLSIVKSEFYIYEFFNTISKELEIYCQKYNTEFIPEIDSPEVIITADAGRINQVIYNLVENAVKYDTNEHKQVHFTIKASLPEKRIYFSVEDNGNGVSMSDISFVFDKFYRAEKSRSMQIPGAGLGLSICKYIVEAHGGEINVESENGKGAKFTFFLNFE